MYYVKNGEQSMLSVKSCMVLVLVTVMAFSFVQLPSGYADLSNPDKVLSFLRDVVQLDITRYNVTLAGTDVAYWPELAGLPQMTGMYVLHNGTNKLEVGFSFINNTLTSCFMFVSGEPPQYSQPSPTDDINAAKGFLQRYQTFTGDLSLTSMRNILDSVDTLTNTIKTSSDAKLEVRVDPPSSAFIWARVSNGASYLGMSLDFRNGVFSSFSDSRSYYKIAGATASVSQDEAINIALKRAETYSYGSGSNVVSNFTIVKDQIRAELNAKTRDKPLELYPCWMITLPLKGVYPGSITYFSVIVWADTGVIDQFLPMGSDVGSPTGAPTISPSPQSSVTPAVPVATVSPSLSVQTTSSPLPNPTVSPSPQQSPTASSTLQPSQFFLAQPIDDGLSESSVLLIVGVVAFLLVAVVTAAFLFKRKAK